MPYLNLDVNYFNHIKTVRLVGLLGRGAAELPLRLWAHCGANIAKAGSLAGYSAQEIESLVGWWGKTGDCVEAMIKVGFIERTGEGFQVHDWDEHEGHLISYHYRAKEAAKARWASVKDATSIPQALPNGNGSNAPAVQCSAIPDQLNQPDQLTKPNVKSRARAPFAKPTAEEVTVYAKSIGFALDGQYFIDRNDATGWVWGRQRQPIKDWKAVVRTWKKFDQENKNGTRTSSNVRLAQTDPERVKAYAG